jgi:DNA polymerase-3 subunit delta'
MYILFREYYEMFNLHFTKFNIVLFKQIIGQDFIKEKLITMANTGRISHTQLFVGPEGSGNLALAIAFAQYVNCQNPQPDDSCGVCGSCVKFDKLIHPDLHFTFPTITPYKQCKELAEDWREALTKNPYLNNYDWLQTIDSNANKQGNITHEECRDIINRLSLTSYEAKFKTQIIWQAEYLNLSGNILLKLLEEPPLGTLIILVAHNTEKVLATILSRAQTIKVPKLSDHDIEESLQKHHQCLPQKSIDIARLADGDYNLAMSLLEVEHDGYFETFSSWMRFCFSGKVDELQKWVDDMAGNGREYVKNFLGYTTQMIRAAFLYKYGDPKLIRVNEQELQFLVKFSSFLHANNLGEIIKSLDEAVISAERNANLKILFLNLSLYIGRQLKSAQKAA